jgi:predicted RNA-binding protein with PUA-like domain
VNYYLVKTEPSTYSISDFEKEKTTIWDGVHNHQAISFIKQMKPGDTVFVYHSMSDKKVVGLARVSGEPYHNTDDQRFSWAVMMDFVGTIDGPTLAECKANSSLATFLLTTHSRLSVMPVPDTVAAWLLSKK